MNNEELQQELNLQFPSEIAGIKRPTEPVESKHDFFLKMPQLISKDPVLYNKMNLLFSILLSNDNALKQNIDTILGKLDNDYAQLDSPEFSGIPTVPTPEEQDNSNKITNTEWVQAWVKAFVAELSNNIEVETQEDGHFSCPALGMTGLMAQNGYICLGKLFGNLILQWGTSSSNVTIYPINFNNCFNVQVWQYDITEYKNSAITNKISFSNENITGYNFYSFIARWFAIGI